MAATITSRLSVPENGIGSMEEGVLLAEIATQVELDRREAKRLGMTLEEYYAWIDDQCNDGGDILGGE
jgi:hypothetical protein